MFFYSFSGGIHKNNFFPYQTDQSSVQIACISAVVHQTYYTPHLHYWKDLCYASLFTLVLSIFCSKFKSTDPGFDKVGKIGTDGRPLVCVLKISLIRTSLSNYYSGEQF